MVARGVSNVQTATSVWDWLRLTWPSIDSVFSRLHFFNCPIHDVMLTLSGSQCKSMESQAGHKVKSRWRTSLLQRHWFPYKQDLALEPRKWHIPIAKYKTVLINYRLSNRFHIHLILTNIWHILNLKIFRKILNFCFRPNKT